jgi:hypothetical protein
MLSNAQNTPETQGHGYWWRRVLNAVLLTASAAATLIALALVVALMWWLSGPSAQPPTVAAARPLAPPLHAPAQPAPQVAGSATVVTRPAAAAVPKRSTATSAMQPAAPAAPVVEALRRQARTRMREGDAERNRAIAQGLQKLAQDPEALRQLRLPDHGATQ